MAKRSRKCLQQILIKLTHDFLPMRVHFCRRNSRNTLVDKCLGRYDVNNRQSAIHFAVTNNDNESDSHVVEENG